VGFLDRLRRAPATSGVLVLLAVVFLATSLEPSLLWRLAKIDARIREGEAWRLLTASFVHGGVLHLLVNGYALAMIGPAVEELYGRVRFGVVFLGGGAVGYVASTFFVRQPSLGASAGVFALLGVLLGFALRARRLLVPAARRALIRELLTVAAINVGFGLMVPYIDNAAHVGGFLGGLAASTILRPRGRAAA
jgi:rhomboid protease GluP